MAVAGCDSEQSVRVENKTDQTVVVYEDGVATELVSPGVTKEFSTLRFRGTLTYEIRFFCEQEICDQSVLASRTVTWEQMQQTDGVTIVVP
jgi:hypothetical protein